MLADYFVPPYFSFYPYYNLNRAFWPDFGGLFQKNVAPIRNLSLPTSPDTLCFFGYSYTMYHVKYYPCGGAVMNGIKDYISIREASYRWGVSERRVNQY